jgi:hypothetical protein
MLLHERKRETIEKLARLLHQPKEIVFRTPACLGWYIEYLNNPVVFVFRLPEDVEPTPLSLLKMFGPQIRPTLGDRYCLAHSLAKSMSQMQLVKWVRGPDSSLCCPLTGRPGS